MLKETAPSLSLKSLSGGGGRGRWWERPGDAESMPSGASGGFLEEAAPRLG